MDTRTRPEDPEPRTLAEQVYARLRRDIVCGDLEPGQKLRLETIRERYEVGMSPLREALSRLAAERLVVATGQKGFRVPERSLQELSDIAGLRIMLETQALTDSFQRADEHWEAGIIAALHRLQKISLPGASALEIEDEWERRHRAFHQALLAACGSPWLLQLCETMTLQFDRYRRPVIKRMRRSEPLHATIGEEHHALAKAAMARDADKAVRLLTAHFKATERRLLAHFRGQPRSAGGAARDQGRPAGP